jgi:ribosome biogenesis SPOUT family RNA methylase Rps3
MYPEHSMANTLNDESLGDYPPRDRTKALRILVFLNNENNYP